MPKALVHFDRRRWPEEAAALDGLEAADLLRVGIDLADAARGLGDIVNARRRGQPVAVLMVYNDPLEALLFTVHSLLAQNPDPDARAIQAKALREQKLTLKGLPLEEHAKPSHAAACAAKFAVLMADLVLVATPADKERVELLAGVPVRRWALLPDPAPFAAQPGTGLTVYAPSIDAAHVQSIATPLRARGMQTQAISAANAGEAIAGSTVVIPEFWRGYRARALAASGLRVVAPHQSGADAFFYSVETYSATDLSSLEDAVDVVSSRGGSAPKLHVERNAISAALAADRPAATRGDLVSIVVRSVDRPQHLRRALASIAAQTYENVEIVLVNNGRYDIPPEVLRAARSRRVVHIRPPQPVKLGEALNLGMRAATGEFVGYLDDDDILYPDHCARSIALLETTGADFCYSKSVGEYARIDTLGAKTVIGMSVYTDRPYRLDALFEGNLTTIHSVVHRRALFERFGYTDESLPVTEDWELWLRMASGGARFVHLDRATCEYSWRDDANTPNTSTQQLASFATAYAIILERYREKVADRPETIEREQENTLAHLRRRAEAVAADPSMGVTLTMQDVLMFAAEVEGLIDDPFRPA
ncbi:MAG TPA: glycosyltransferase [Candidatus Baltobacteraceae bacterium]|nr:glycosyltransferase [Candidatus Baltobacteraceae bacterium]